MLDEEEELSLAYEPPLSPLDISVLWNRLIRLEFSDKASLLAFEQDLYRAFKLFPNNGAYSILMLQIQLMLGNLERARSLAYRIWEIGGVMKPKTEKSYINDLLNLGLIEMASILLKPYFEKMSTYIEDYGHLFLKYAIASGQLLVIEKTASQLLSAGAKKALTDFSAVYRYLNYTETFKGIQRRILELVKDTLCSYEFNIYTDRGFTDLEILLYVGNETLDYDKLQEMLEIQVSAVCAAKGSKKLNNLSYSVLPISSYILPPI